MAKAIEKLGELAKEVPGEAKKSVFELASSMLQDVEKMMKQETEDRLSTEQQRDLNSVQQKINELSRAYANDVIITSMNRADLFQRLSVEIGNVDVESSHELLIALDHALTHSITKMVAESVGEVIRHGKVDDERKQREYASENVRNTIRSFVSVQMADQIRQAGGAINTARGSMEFQDWRQETENFLWEKIKEVSAWGIAFVTLGARKIEMEHARIINNRMADYFRNSPLRSYGSMPEIISEWQKTARNTETLENRLQAARSEGRRLLWASFASRLERNGGGWTQFKPADGAQQSSSFDAALLNEIEVSDIQHSLISELGLTNPIFCVIGPNVFVHHEGDTWMRAEINTLKNAAQRGPRDIFQPSDVNSYIAALRTLPDFQGENGAVVAEIVSKLGNNGEMQAALTERIVEKLTIQRNFGPYTRAQLSAMGGGRDTPAEIGNTLGDLLGRQFQEQIRKFRLNFIRPNILQGALDTKKNAILDVMKNMKIQETLATMDEEGKKDAEAAGQEFKPHEKFIFEIYHGGNVIRLLPEKPHDWEKQRFAGATRDSIEAKIREELENPFASVPILGAMFASLTKIPLIGDKIKDMLNGLARSESIQKTFGIKPPAAPQDIDAEVARRSQEEMRRVIDTLTTRYPLIAIEFTGTVNEFVVNENPEPHKGLKSIMLHNTLEKFTGTIEIPANSCVRFSDFVEVQKGESGPIEGRENIYAGSEGMTLNLTDQKIAQYSIFPVGTKFTRHFVSTNSH